MDLIQPVIIALLVIVEVALWQLRIVLTNRSYRLAAAAVGGLDGVVYVTALAQVLTNLDNPLNIAGFAVGVTVGVLLGSYLGDRLASGQLEIRFVVEGDGSHLVQTLRNAGWPVTAVEGDGLDGPVTIAFVAVDGTNVGKVTSLVENMVPGAFWTIEQLSKVRPVALPNGFVQAGMRRLALARHS